MPPNALTADAGASTARLLRLQGQFLCRHGTVARAQGLDIHPSLASQRLSFDQEELGVRHENPQGVVIPGEGRFE